jgi:flagellar protein FlgJ
MRGLYPPDNGAKTQPLDEKQKHLKELCSEMESIFISVLMRQMRQTVWKSDFLPETSGDDIFKSMWETEVAGRVEKGSGGFGIADSIYKELERQGEWRKPAQDSQFWSL